MRKPLIPTIILIAYSALVFKFLVFKTVVFKIGHLMFNFSGQSTGPANIVPFRTIWPYLLGEKGKVIAIFEIAGNIGLFIPIGFLFPYLYRNMTWQKILILAVGAPLLIEVIQLIFRVGTFDIDDVILNGLGVVVGFLLYSLLKRWFLK